jgi:hypothetical protein
MNVLRLSMAMILLLLPILNVNLYMYFQQLHIHHTLSINLPLTLQQHNILIHKTVLQNIIVHFQLLKLHQKVHQKYIIM